MNGGTEHATERAAFEAAMNPRGIVDMWLEKDEAGDYTFSRTRDAWMGWQERAALAADAIERTLQGVKGQVRQMLAANVEFSEGAIEYRLRVAAGQMPPLNFPKIGGTPGENGNG